MPADEPSERRPLKVLLISPLRDRDPLTGDVTYTENLVASPPEGVVFETHDAAMTAGAVRERARRDSVTRGRLARRVVVEGLLLGREKVILQLRKRGLLLWEPFRYFEILGDYDLVHVHTFSVKLTGKVPPLVVSNGADLRDLYTGARGWSAGRAQALIRVDALLARLFGVAHIADPRRAASIVTFTDHLRETYLGSGHHPSTVVTIGPGVPNRADNANERTPRTVGFLASDFTVKGGADLLAAVPAVVECHPSLQVHVAGSSTPVSDLPAAVAWLGPLTRDEVVSTFFPRIDVFAYPTHFDGASLVLQEALSFGVPVVTSDFGPIPEMTGFGRAGVVVPVGDVDALASAITEVLEPRAHAKYAEGARDVFCSRFDQTRCASRLREVYDAVINGARPRRYSRRRIGVPRFSDTARPTN